MQDFDFLVLGGGSAGCVIASRLSENPDVTVALVEAGNDGRGWMIRTPLAGAAIGGTEAVMSAIADGRYEQVGTFNGNPLAMAVGLKALSLIDSPETLGNVNEIAGYLKQQLAGLQERYPDVIVDVRGKGLLIGVKLVPNNREFMALARDTQKLLVAGGGDNCVRLLPPLNLTLEEAREAIDKFEGACKAARATLAA